MRSALFTLLITSGLFAQTAGTINTIAGTGGALFSGDGGAATLSGLNVAVDVSADRNGNLYIADQFNHRIRRIAANGVITTVAGTGTPGYSGDGGPAVNAQINTPTGVFADTAGNIYIAEPGNQRIRKVDPSGTITTIAGNGSKGYSGDGGPATSASLYNAVRVAVDPAGTLLSQTRATTGSAASLPPASSPQSQETAPALLPPVPSLAMAGKPRPHLSTTQPLSP